MSFRLDAKHPRLDLVEWIDGWLCSEPMRMLVELFSQGWKLDFAPHAEFYNTLVSFVDRRWNSRGVITTERYETVYKQVPLYLHDEVRLLVTNLGLLEPSLPVDDRYDVIIVPGSQLWGMLTRVGYIRELSKLGVGAEYYVGLGCRRTLSSDEQNGVRLYSLHGSDELTLMDSIFRSVLSGAIKICPQDSPPTDGSWRTHLLLNWSAGVGAVSIFETADIDGRRPTTVDTLRNWIDKFPYLDDIRRVLIVTQPLFKYQQGAVAIEVLGLDNGLDVEVVGAAGKYLPDIASPELPVARILQEVNGSVKRLVGLRERLVQSAPSSQ